MAEVTTLLTNFFSKPFSSKTVAELENSVTAIFSTSVSLKNSQDNRRVITMEEVSRHDEPDDCWIIIFDRIYDVTFFLDEVSNFMTILGFLMDNYDTCWGCLAHIVIFLKTLDFSRSTSNFRSIHFYN